LDSSLFFHTSLFTATEVLHETALDEFKTDISTTFTPWPPLKQSLIISHSTPCNSHREIINNSRLAQHPYITVWHKRTFTKKILQANGFSLLFNLSLFLEQLQLQQKWTVSLLLEPDFLWFRFPSYCQTNGIKQHI